MKECHKKGKNPTLLIDSVVSLTIHRLLEKQSLFGERPVEYELVCKYLENVVIGKSAAILNDLKDTHRENTPSKKLKHLRKV